MKRLTRFLGLVAAAAVLWFSGPARAQYTHRQNPGDTSQTLPSLSATGAYVCLGTAGAATDLLTLSGAATGATVAFWHTPDQVNYYALPLYPISQTTGGWGPAATTYVYTASTPVSFIGPSLGDKQFCVSLTAISTSSVSFQMDADPAPMFSVASAPPGSSLNPAVPATGSLATSGNIVSFNISGAQWATARFVFSGTFASQTLEFDYSIDGVNWTASGQGAPYVKRVDAVSANPSVVIGSTATQGGNSLSFNINTYGASTWELPLAGNVQAVRVKALSTAGAAVVTISAGLPYVPGDQTTYTFFDVTSAANTALNTGILEVAGWNSALVFESNPAAGSGQILQIDDAGGNMNAAMVAIGAIPAWFNLAKGNGASLTATVSTQGVYYAPLPKRIIVNTIAVSGLTSRIRIEASR